MSNYLGKHRLMSFTCINQSCLPELETRLREASILTLKIDGSNISDRTTFMRQAEHDLPYPEWARTISKTHDSWDSFNDIFGSCITDLNKQKVAIVWTHVEDMLAGSLSDLLNAVNNIDFVGYSLYNSTEPSQRISLYLFLAGEGANFPVIEF